MKRKYDSDGNPLRKDGRRYYSRGKRGPHLYGKATRVNESLIPQMIDIVRLRIQDLRLEREISYAELSAATGHAIGQLVKFERTFREASNAGIKGVAKDIRLSTLIRIALAFKVSVRELMP
jgi:DNA-binding Xre family transcriptional regulator